MTVNWCGVCGCVEGTVFWGKRGEVRTCGKGEGRGLRTYSSEDVEGHETFFSVVEALG